MCVCITPPVCHSTHSEVRGELAEVNSLLLSYTSQGMNSGHQVYWVVTFSTESSHYPSIDFARPSTLRLVQGTDVEPMDKEVTCTKNEKCEFCSLSAVNLAHP